VLHVVEAGESSGGAQDKSAKTICLLHGFPDFWLSWRRQLPGLTEAGYRVLCPDLRGYAKSSQPKAIDRYSEVRCVCACHPVRLPAYIDTATQGARGKRRGFSPEPGVPGFQCVLAHNFNKTESPSLLAVVRIYSVFQEFARAVQT